MLTIVSDLFLTDAFLIKHGCALASTIIMTKDAYMTDEAWLSASKAIFKSYCDLPCVKENEQWFVLKILAQECP